MVLLNSLQLVVGVGNLPIHGWCPLTYFFILHVQFVHNVRVV
jgi:hypothetical protein